jgi:hypothetical protein
MQHSLKLLNGAAILLVLAASIVAACNQGSDNSKTPEGLTKRPLPHMWVDDNTSQRDEGNFFPIARSLSTSTLQETDSIQYSLTEFQQMITAFGNMPSIKYLDLYPVVRKTTGKLDILFAPEDADCNTIGYFQLREGATSWSQTGDAITEPDALAWQDLYESTVVQQLKPMLDRKDPGNHINGVIKTPLLNTLHLSHFYTDFTELLSEIKYQASLPQSNKIDGFKAFFSAKPQQPGGRQYAYGNRLYIILEYTIGTKVFYIKNDNTRTVVGADLPEADACTSNYFILQRNRNDTATFHTLGNNNGQMCPPSCNP